MLIDVLVLNQFHIADIIPTWGQLGTLKIFYWILKSFLNNETGTVFLSYNIPSRF